MIRSLLLTAAALVLACSPRPSSTYGHRVGTDVHFPSGGTGSGIAPDGGVTYPVQGNGSVASPISFDAWAARQQAAMKAAVPALNAFTFAPVSQQTFTSPFVAASCEGGCTGVASDVAWGFFTPLVLQTPNTSPWALVFTAKFPAGVTGKLSLLGAVSNSSGSNGYVFGWSTPTFGKWELSGVTSTFNSDTNWHNVIVSSDLTTLKAFVDGVLVASTTAGGSGNVPIGLAALSSATLTPGVLVARYGLGYVSPVVLQMDNSPSGVLQSDFIGLGATAPAFTEMVGNSAALVSIDYQRQVDSGLKIVRTLNDLGWICPGFPNVSGCPTYGGANQLAFESWLSHQQAAGINVMVNAGWNYPNDACAIFGGATCSPTAQNKTDFSALYSADLDHLINGKGFTNVVGVNVFTEPPLNAPTDQANYAALATQFVNKIVSDDAGRTPIRPRVIIAGPQEHNFVTSSDTWLKYMRANTSGVFDVLTEHSYCNQPPFAPLGMGESSCPGTGSFATFFPDWLTKWQTWEADASPTPFWTDEFNQLANDPQMYRRSGDDGLLLDRLVSSHLAAGIQADFMWMFSDQMVGPFSKQGYGLARDLSVSADVWPAWYAFTAAANLLGGGRGSGGAHSVIYRTLSNTATTNAGATFTPAGARGCSDPAGCLTMMVANGSAGSIDGNWTSSLPINRRMCRTLYQSESTPRPTPIKAAYRLPWDSCANVVSQYPDNLIPPHSVAFYSTVANWAPASTSLSPSASVTASSNGSGNPANVADGSTSHVTSVWNSWVPNSGASGTQWVQLNWATPQAMNRIVLDLVGTSEPFFYGTGTDATHPAPLAAYTVQYWNGSAFVDFPTAINVSGNGQLQRTHTFASVSTTEVRVSVAQGTTAPINEVEVYNDPAGLDTVLGLYGWTDPTSASGDIDAETISTKAHTFQANEFIEYDVTLMDNLAAIGGIDVTVDTGCGGAFSTLSSVNWQDQNGLAGAPSTDLSSRAYPSTYHRKLAVPSCAVGHISQTWQLVTQRSDRTCQTYVNGCPGNAWFGAGATVFYDNIVVTAGGSTVATIYANGSPDTVSNVSSVGYKNVDVFVAPKQMS